jgi:hypothetical protein
MWRNECAEVREYYKTLAEEEKANHLLQHPDYKCSPRKSSQLKKRKRSLDDDSYLLNPPIELPILLRSENSTVNGPVASQFITSNDHRAAAHQV